MKKKTYMRPSMRVVKLNCTDIIACSFNSDINDGGNHGYQQDGYNDYIGGGENGIWGHGDPD